MREIRYTEYELLHDAYYGTGLFLGGRGLQPHARESEDNYRKRQSLAYYLNYVAPIINSSIDPIFKDTIDRDYNAVDVFEAFLENVDKLGTSLQEFMRRTAVSAKLYGVVYVVVDNTLNRDGASVLEVLQEERYPHLTVVKPEQVTDWRFDAYGRLLEFEYVSKVQLSKEKATTTHYKWTAEECIAYDENHKEIGRVPHNLGVLPVVQWFGRNTAPTSIKPTSEYISIAQTNYHIYQVCSWLTQTLQGQSFNILTMPDPGGNEDITIGISNVLTYDPMATHTPSFIAPDSAPAKLHVEHIEKLVKEMYRMSGIDSVVGVQEAKSGVAKQWDFERTNQRLADFAVHCENAEKRIVDLFELWTGTKIDYRCEYPRDFKINDITESLVQAQQAMDLQLGSGAFKLEIAKKVLAAYLPNIEPDIYDEIVGEIEEGAKQEKIDTTYTIEDDEDGFETA